MALGIDEPASNYPRGNRRTQLAEPHSFMLPTGRAYFFVPSITALQTVFT